MITTPSTASLEPPRVSVSAIVGNRRSLYRSMRSRRQISRGSLIDIDRGHVEPRSGPFSSPGIADAQPVEEMLGVRMLVHDRADEGDFLPRRRFASGSAGGHGGGRRGKERTSGQHADVSGVYSFSRRRPGGSSLHVSVDCGFRSCWWLFLFFVHVLSSGWLGCLSSSIHSETQTTTGILRHDHRRHELPRHRRQAAGF